MAINKGYLTAKTDKASDEVYTPSMAIEVLIPYIKQFKEDAIIWCPFDEPWSQYVTIFEREGFKVIHSHIDEGKNFFTYEPDEPYDVIISNPPFSIKDDVLRRITEINKPFALLLPVPVIQGQKRFEYMKDCQIMTFDKRINYYKDRSMTEVQKGVSFGSLYLCKNFLPKDVIWQNL